jgi:hypothetical protein
MMKHSQVSDTGAVAEADRSYHQHGAQLLAGSYGAYAARETVVFLGLANGTQFFMQSGPLSLLVELLLDGMRWMMVHQYYWQWSVVGRSMASHIARPADGLGHFLQHIPSNRSDELQEFAVAMAGGETSESGLRGHRAYWCSDYAVQSSESPDGTPWVTTLMMHSNRTTAAACVNGQGANNEHIGDAMQYLYYEGTEYDGMFGSWRWNRLPGITAEQLPVMKCAYRGRLTNDSALMDRTGSVSNGVEGLSAMSLVSHNLTAKKSVALLQHVIVNMVAAVRCSSKNSVFSTADSSITAGDVTVAWTNGTRALMPVGTADRAYRGVSWVHHGQTAYVFDKADLIEITKDFVSVTNRRVLFEIGIRHGARATGLQESAAWQTIPGISLQHMQTGVETGVTIVANTGDVQAVIDRHKSQGLAAFWSARKTAHFPAPLSFSITSSHPATIIITDAGESLNITANDPTNNQAGLDIELTVSACQGSTVHVQLPSGWNAGQSASVQCRKKASALKTDDDFHFPSEEPDELVSALTIRVGSINVRSQTVSISHAGEHDNSPVTLAVGETALTWTLRSVFAPTGQSPTAILERNWARWGALIYLQEIGATPSDWAPCSVAPSNACVFLRKGLGEVSEIKRPRYALTEIDAGYWSKATTSTDDYLKQLMINETDDHEALFASAASVLPPTKDYGEVKNVQSHSGFSVSPQGRVMSANFSIREMMERGDAPLSPGGLLLFDPKDHLPFSWPDTNWTEMKSATLGRFSRAVTVGVFEPSSGQGFSLLATPNPHRGIETQPYDRAELLLRLEVHKSEGSAAPQYFAVEACALCGPGPMENCSEVSSVAQCGEHPKLVSSIDHAQFYSMLLEHNVEWQQFHRGADVLNLQIHGLTEGTRVVDTARSVISAGMANFIHNRPNYGDGSVYWSVTTDDHGALPLQSFALNNALLLWGHHKQAAERLEYYFNVFVRNTSGITPRNEPGMQRELWDHTPGKIDFKNWGPDARSGWPKVYQHYFQDSIADYGRFLDLWSETARAMEDEDPSWIQRTFVTVRTMSQHLFALHDNATHTRASYPAAGLIVGPAEHDTCKDRGPFFSINFWTWRGWVEVSRFLADTAAVRDAAFASQLSAHVTQLQADLKVAVRESLVKKNGKAFFLPPFAAVGFQPYKSMIAKTRGHEPGNGCPDSCPTNCTPTTLKDRLCNCEGYAGGPTYAGFRYYSEMLSSSFLEPEVANAINDFREAHTGTLSGMTRYEDHLDDMPASGYGHSAVSLSRTESFQALFYGHLANYQSRGVYSAPEQESLYGDGVHGKHFTDSFRATLGEVAVDICVPSTMLPAIMARWMVLFTERDSDTIALFRMAPRRFFRPSLASPAMVLERGLTRYGKVSANITVTPMPDDGNCSESAVLALSLDTHGRGYVGKTGGLTIEMRVRAHGDCRSQRTLSAATVMGDIGAHTVSVKSDTETVTLHLTAEPARRTHAFEVHAMFTAAADESSLKVDDESIFQTPAQAGMDLQRRIDAAINAGKPATVVIPAGDYFFSKSLTISGARQLKLVGSGASNLYFDWRNYGAGVLFNQSTDVHLSGVSVDYDPPAHYQGSVLRFNGTTHTATGSTIDAIVKTDRGFAEPKVFLEMVKGTWIEDRHNPVLWNSSDPELGSYAAADYVRDLGSGMHLFRIPLTDIIGGKTITAMCGEGEGQVMPGGGSCAAKPADGSLPHPNIGDKVTIHFRGGLTYHVMNSTRINTSDVGIHGATAFAITEYDGRGGHTYRNVSVGRRGDGVDRRAICGLGLPSGGRLCFGAIASNNDAFHSSGVKVGPKFMNGELSYCLDDFWNVHSRAQVVFRRESDTSLLVIDPRLAYSAGVPDNFAYGNAETLTNCRPHDKLSFWHKTTFAPQSFGIVASLERLSGPGADARLLLKAQAFLDVNMSKSFDLDAGVHCAKFGCVPRLWRVQFAAPVPAEVGPTSLVSLEGWDNSGAVVENTHMHHGFYGLRWKSSNGRVANNLYSGKYMEVTPLEFYMEGPFEIHHVEVSGNCFAQCGIENVWRIRDTVICDAEGAKLPAWPQGGEGGVCRPNICSNVTVSENTIGPALRSDDDSARTAAFLELWVEPLRAGALQAAVDTAAASLDGPVTIHLAPGAHLLSRPLILDERHTGTRFIGHGGASVSGAVRIGAVPDGGINLTGWTVVGQANCSGCGEIWRAAIPAGSDSRQFYVNTRRANRTWIGMPLLPLIGAKKTFAGTSFTVPGEQILSWTHNASSIEAVYRGAGSAGSQWTESRCPVISIANGSQPAVAATTSGSRGAEKCVADYCSDKSCPKCCGESGLMPKNESANGGPGSRVCPLDLPICRGYLANEHWGTCHADTNGPCCASWCEQAGCSPTGMCGNGGLIMKGKDYGQGNRSAVCDKDLPFCANYLVNKHWGTCQSLPDYGKGSAIVALGQPCADSGNVKGQKLNVPSYVENVFELLGHREAGHPGEFFIDSGAGHVYYVPHPGETVTNTVGHLPLLERLIDAQGSSNLTFSAITFEHTTWMRPSTGVGYVEVQAGFCTVCTHCSCGNEPCQQSNCSCAGAETPAAVRFFGTTKVKLDSCTWRHIGSNGVSFSGGSHCNTVSRSLFEDISASAIAIGTRSGSVATMTASQQDINNTVSDCTITNVANVSAATVLRPSQKSNRHCCLQEYRGHPGILIGFSHGTKIEHNEIAHVPYTAISV